MTNDVDIDISREIVLGDRLDRPVQKEPKEPTTKEVVGGILKSESWLYNAGEMFLAPKFTELENFSYIPEYDMEGYEAYADQLLDARSPEEMSYLKNKIDERKSGMEAFANGNIFQKAAGFATLVGTDPMMALGVGGTAYKAYRTTGRILDGALKTAGVGFATEAASEAVLQQNQIERGADETITNVAAATVLSGLLGGFAAGLSKPEFYAIAKKLDEDLRVPTDQQLSSVGAKQNATTKEEEEVSGLKRYKKIYESLPAFAKNPVFSGALSESVETRRITEELADLAVVKNKNFAGTANEASIESLIKDYNVLRVGFYSQEKDLYKKYLNRAKLGLPQEQQIGSKSGGIMSRQEFNEQLFEAGINNDTHVVPEVADLAKYARQNVYNPVLERAKESGLLDDLDEYSVETADTWMKRLYNTDKIIAEYDQFKKIAVDDLREKQAIKLQTQEEILPRLEKIRDLRNKSRSLDRKLERAKLKGQSLEAKQEEIRRFNKFAFQRSQQLSEPLDQIRTNIDSLSKQIEDSLDDIEFLTEEIAKERAEFPWLVEAERDIQRVSRALYDINKRAELVDVADVADELEEGLASLQRNYKEGLAKLREVRKDYRASPLLDKLKELEQRRKLINKEIAPYSAKLKQLRKELRQQEKTKKPLARGGAVFETAIRKRGSVVADQSSGAEAKVASLEEELIKTNNLINQITDELAEISSSYKGKSGNEARSAVKRLNARMDDAEAALEKRFKDIDKSILRSSKRILRSPDYMDVEIEEIADQIIERITNVTAGRLPYDVSNSGKGFSDEIRGTRGSAKARAWDISDHKIKDYLIRDGRALMESYLRTMAPDVELMQRYKSLTPEPLIQRIAEDYRKKRNAKVKDKKTGQMRSLNKSELAKLSRNQKRDVTNVNAMWDKLRATYAMPDDYTAPIHVIERTALGWNFVSKLGDVVASSLPDIGRPIMVLGFQKTFGRLMSSLVSDKEALGIGLKEVSEEIATAMDLTMATTTMARMNMDDYMQTTSKVDEVTQKVTTASSLMFGQNHYNYGMKTFTGLMVQSDMVDSILKLAEGKKINSKKRAWLANNFIDDDMLARIGEQFKKHGESRGGLRILNAKNWDDAEARRLFRMSVRKVVDEIIVTPGLDRPLWMSRPGWRLIGQFKSFGFSATNRVLAAGLQRSDANTFLGAMSMIFVGSLVYAYKETVAGREVSDDWRVWVANGVDRSGVLGIYMDANNIVEKVTRGTFGINAMIGGPIMSRYANRNLAGTLLGPSMGMAQDIFSVVGAASSGEVSEADIHAARRIMPLQNAPLFRGAFDAIENSAKSIMIDE